MNAIRIYKSGIHHGEESIVRGNEKSGMINFSGCHLRCNFCYTKETSFKNEGINYSSQNFSLLLHNLEKEAKNLNFISPTLAWPNIQKTLEKHCSKIPLILKISGYENDRYIDSMRPFCDIWVPDFKVFSEEAAISVNLPKNYGTVTLNAIQSMMKSHSNLIFDSDSKLVKGIIIRHLLMPGYFDEAVSVIKALNQIGFKGYLNLMTNFIDPNNKKIFRTSTKDIATLSQEVKNTQMKLLINGINWGVNDGL